MARIVTARIVMARIVMASGAEPSIAERGRMDRFAPLAMTERRISY
jgi:hypothetical protein